MATKTRKLTATTEVGTFTRRTARTYSHVIVRHEVITLEEAAASRFLNPKMDATRFALVYGMKDEHTAIRWVGRPDLVAAALSNPRGVTLTAYPVDV
jgi:hypothetical protein